MANPIIEFEAGDLTPEFIARYWAKVDKRGPDDCWLWLGARNGRGYGVISLDGRNLLAHRVAVILAGGQFTAELPFAAHRCGNPSCVNPAHIRPATHSENVLEGRAPAVTVARHTAIDHCPQGHPYTAENTRIGRKRQANGRPISIRICRECNRQQDAKRYAAKRSDAKAEQRRMMR